MNFNRFQQISTSRNRGFTPHHFSLKKSGAGFTIIEMLVAVALFTVVAVVSVGSILALVDANQKARSLKSVMDNLHFALQGMTLAIQVGRDFTTTGETILSFQSADDEDVIYAFAAGQLYRSINGGVTYTAVTAPEVKINAGGGKFYLAGATPGDMRQSLIIITIKGTAGKTTKTQSSFFVQTSVSPRRLDD